MPPEMRDELAQILLQLVGKDQPVVHLSAAEEASFEESLIQAWRVRDRRASARHLGKIREPALMCRRESRQSSVLLSQHRHAGQRTSNDRLRPRLSFSKK